jgi:hypothetical protein
LWIAIANAFPHGRHHHQHEAASEETAKYCKPLFAPAFGSFFHAGFEGLKGLLLAQRVEVRFCFNLFRTAN